MLDIVIPYRAAGKTRLPEELRAELSRSMLADVLAAARGVGRVVVVTDDPTAVPSAVETVADPGEGQGAAVAVGLGRAGGHVLVVNADLPCVTPAALRRLGETGAALVAAADGTTNALSLPDPGRFEPLFGPGSAARFAALGLSSVAIPELEHDVDTLDDLDAIDVLALPLGRHTRLATDCCKAGDARIR